MNKRTIILFAILATLLTSCTLDEFFEKNGQTGTTTVIFTPDFDFCDGEVATKAFADVPQIENLYLAVFNEGGKALIEYVKADPFTQAEGNGIKYAYTATLKTSNKPRIIHFIANAPEDVEYGSDVDAVGNLSYNFDRESWTGQDAYWGYLELENGICKETDPAFSSLQSALSSVKLIRNFAKIKVETGTSSNFTITRFWISNFPDCSMAAPYNRNARRFETCYASYSRVTTAMAAGYMGFCPASSGLVSLSGLDEAKLDAIACTPGAVAYTYEREIPVRDPLCIIVGGTSDLSSTETFYKIDLRDNDGKYLPVLRNFTYTVAIGSVLKVGEPTVEAALKSVSSGALDTDISLQGLKDLSNGKSRIAVSETERVLFDSQPFGLMYSFIPEIYGVNSGTVVNKTLDQWASEGYPTEADVKSAHLSYVTIGFEPGLSGNVIDSYVITENDEIDGYRKVLMTPVAESDIIKTEVVTVTGHVWNAENGRYETLQRTVNYQMRPRLDMILTLTPDRIPMAIGTPINLTIGIEENLPQSLFTLNMKITSEQMTLTPGDKTLPISSEVGADGKPVFFLTRAITWEEYSSTPSVMDADGILRKHFDCPLKVNTSNFRDVDPSFGQGDRVLVSNEYFNTSSALFIAGDDNLNRFINPHLDKEYLVAGRPASIIFGMTQLPSDGTIFVRMLGMEPADTDILEYKGAYPEDEQYSVYEMAVSNPESESFTVRATSDAVAYFQLFDVEFNGYSPAEIQVQTPGFSDLRFNYNNLGYVVAGKQAMATFHMDYIPMNGQVKIYLKNAVPVEVLSGTSEADGYTSYVIPATTEDVEFPVMISPASAEETRAYFKITADNYNDSAVAESNIQKLNFSNLKLINLLNTATDYVVGGRPARIDFTLDDMPSIDNVITIRLNNMTLGSSRSGVSDVTDNGDGSYNLSVFENHIILDVTPTVGETVASYEVSDAEFNTGNCSAEIKRLSFSSLKLVNVKDPDNPDVIGGKPVCIQFTLEDIPANNDGKITLALTNLALADPATGYGFSSMSGSDGVYEIIVTDNTVKIDATPVVGSTSATFSLSDDEFYDAECTTTVKKLSFSNLEFTVNTGTSYLLAGDMTSKISFVMDQLPNDGNVAVWIKNASVSGASAGTSVGGFTPYTVPVTTVNTSLDISVNGTGFSTGNNKVEFYVADDEFTTSNTVATEVKTRYTINWANVQIKTDYPDEEAASLTGIGVYTDASCTETAATISTNGSGYASGVSMTVDSYDGEEEYYYFKFTRNGIDYKSENVTLADLAAGTTVTGIAQEKEYTIKSGTLKFGNKNGGTVKVRIGTSTILSSEMTITGAPNKGYNSGDYKISCLPNSDIYFIDGKNTYGPHKIENLANITGVLTIY